MNFIKNFLKGKMKELLEMLNIPTNQKFCCLNPDHDDAHPSMSFNSKDNTVHCFACGATYDIFDVIGIEYHLDSFKERMNKAIELFGTGEKMNSTNEVFNSTTLKAKENENVENVHLDFSGFYRDSNLNLNAEENPGKEYLLKRGISLDTANKFQIGYAEDYEQPCHSIIIPTSQSCYIQRNVDAEGIRYRERPNGGKKKIFNLEVFNKSPECVFVSEGPFDALSIEEVGFPAIALGSVSMIGQFTEFLRKNEIDVPLVLALDSDEAGKKATAELSNTLDELHITFYVIPDFGGHKDPNETLISSREQFSSIVLAASDILKNIKQVEKDTDAETYRTLYSVEGHRSTYIETMRKMANPISTGFKFLDKSLGGGFRQGVYVLGAITSLGKTTLISQIAENIAKSGLDVLYISEEMSEAEIISKGISRNSCIIVSNPDHRLDSDLRLSKNDVDQMLKVANDEANVQLKVLNASVDDFFEHARTMYVIEEWIDVYSMEKIIENHINKTGKKPVVFIDYLQILKPVDSKISDKMNIDIEMSQLKCMSKKYNLSIVVLSSLNRQNYKEPVSMVSFKESGGIEYWVDCLMGLQFSSVGTPNYNELEEKKKVPRDVEVVILKNRHSEVGVAVKFAYYAKYNYFFEKLFQK